jgi:hypothetical protein
MKVLIIGAGWYGCHISNILLEKGIDICIVDKANTLFSGSSSKNQNRLHLGFHYPRSKETMDECLRGYYAFLNLYSHLTERFDKNLYFISSNQSYMSMASYIDTMSNHCDKFKLYTGALPLAIQKVEATVLEVEELYIDPIKSTDHFKQLLYPHFKRIDDPSAFASIDSICQASGDSYDLVINCTYNMLNPIQFDHYELFVSLLYKINAPETFAYTIMDGPFFSIYPYDIDNHIYTVTSVTHGVAYKGLSADCTLSSEHLETIIQKMEQQIVEYIPDWKSVALYESYYTSWKTKPDSKTDDRSLKHSYENGILNIYGGKITGIFDAERIVLSILKEHM